MIAVLGAGEIGGAVARALAMRGTAGAVRLIDEHSTIAAGKALDLRQSMPIAGADTPIDGLTDFSAASGASVVVLADPAAGGDWSGEPALALFRRLSRLGLFETSVLICAGAGHAAVMQQAFDELKLSRARAIGSAPEAYAATARALVALEAGSSAAQVSLSVLGNLPRAVIPWSDANIAGHSATAILSPPQIARIERRLAGLWPPGPSTLGTAAAQFCEATANGSRRIVNAFVGLDRDNGTKAPVCAWTVVIGPRGLERVTTPALTQKDRVALDAFTS